MKTGYISTISFLFIVFFSLASTVKAQEFFTTSRNTVTLTVPTSITLVNVSLKDGAKLKVGDKIRKVIFLLFCGSEP